MVFAFALLAAILSTADETPQQRLEALKKDHATAEAKYEKAVQELPETPEGEKQADRLWKEFDGEQSKRFLAAVELAGRDPNSDLSLASLEFVLTHPRSYYLPAGLPAMKMATEYHAANPKVGRIVAVIGRVPPSDLSRPKEHEVAFELIRAVADKNKDKTARGQAKLALAIRAAREFVYAECNRTKDADALAAEAEKQFESALKEYGDQPDLAGSRLRTIGDRAKEELFELRFLRVGKTAPELEGEDLDGKKFKLSDSHGKVTVVVFWATWCGPCMAQVPHEKKLVDRMKGKPFVLIGVNDDLDREKTKQVVKKEEITWRSFWNGKERAISNAWNVRSWPTVYVLDEKGVIRYKHVLGQELDAAVDDVLKLPR